MVSTRNPNRSMKKERVSSRFSHGNTTSAAFIVSLKGSVIAPFYVSKLLKRRCYAPRRTGDSISISPTGLGVGNDYTVPGFLGLGIYIQIPIAEQVIQDLLLGQGPALG